MFRRRVADTTTTSGEKGQPFSAAELARFRAEHGDIHAILVLRAELLCDACSKPFPTSLLCAAPIAYANDELGAPRTMKVADRTCPSCRKEEKSR